MCSICQLSNKSWKQNSTLIVHETTKPGSPDNEPGKLKIAYGKQRKSFWVDFSSSVELVVRPFLLLPIIYWLLRKLKQTVVTPIKIPTGKPVPPIWDKRGSRGCCRRNYGESQGHEIVYFFTTKANQGPSTKGDSLEGEENKAVHYPTLHSHAALLEGAWRLTMPVTLNTRACSCSRVLLN